MPRVGKSFNIGVKSNKSSFIAEPQIEQTDYAGKFKRTGLDEAKDYQDNSTFGGRRLSSHEVANSSTTPTRQASSQN